MAGYKGHVVGGLVAGATVVGANYFINQGAIPDSAVLASDWQSILGVLLISTLFGLWPDVDTNSKAQDIFFGLAFAFDALLIVFGYFAAAALLGFLAMTPIVGSHRGWTHSRITMLVLPSPIVIIPYLSDSPISTTGWLMYGSATLGIFSHLLLDGLIIKRIRVKSAWRS